MSVGRGDASPKEIVVARQEKVEDLLRRGYLDTMIAKEVGFDVRTVRRDKKEIVDRWVKENTVKTVEDQKRKLTEWNERMNKLLSSAQSYLSEAQEANDKVFASRMMNQVRELEKLIADVNTRSGNLPNVPQEVVNTIQTGKQFVLSWKAAKAEKKE